jgi:hypothetical protein
MWPTRSAFGMTLAEYSVRLFHGHGLCCSNEFADVEYYRWHHRWSGIGSVETS